MPPKMFQILSATCRTLVLLSFLVQPLAPIAATAATGETSYERRYDQEIPASGATPEAAIEFPTGADAPSLPAFEGPLEPENPVENLEPPIEAAEPVQMELPPVPVEELALAPQPTPAPPINLVMMYQDK